MEPRIKPVPAFYCCYLLRSSVRHASHYIGSSPHPSRRLAQHNGKAKGGAVRTSRLTLRPWDMVCMVAGFPSNIAALQFEWAWDKPHLTRHIAPEQRITVATTRTKVNPLTNKARKRPGRPRTSMMDKLSNLHLLLQSPYFSRLPLEVRFFDERIYRSWQSWCERTDGQLNDELKVLLDLPQDASTEELTSSQPSKKKQADRIGKGGVEGTDPTYAGLQSVLEKSRFLVDEGDAQKCAVCHKGVDVLKDLFTICPAGSCTSISHITCLSQRFLGNDLSRLVPISGPCPSCDTTSLWIDLMKALSLRIRGKKEVERLLNKKRPNKASVTAALLEDDDDDDGKSDGEEADQPQMEEEESEVDSADDGPMSVVSNDTLISPLRPKRMAAGSEAVNSRLEIVIEDSEDDA